MNGLGFNDHEHLPRDALLFLYNNAMSRIKRIGYGNKQIVDLKKTCLKLDRLPAHL